MQVLLFHLIGSEIYELHCTQQLLTGAADIELL